MFRKMSFWFPPNCLVALAPKKMWLKATIAESSVFYGEPSSCPIVSTSFFFRISNPKHKYTYFGIQNKIVWKLKKTCQSQRDYRKGFPYLGITRASLMSLAIRFGGSMGRPFTKNSCTSRERRPATGEDTKPCFLFGSDGKSWEDQLYCWWKKSG